MCIIFVHILYVLVFSEVYQHCFHEYDLSKLAAGLSRNQQRAPVCGLTLAAGSAGSSLPSRTL